MPVKVEKRDGEWCVVEPDGSAVKCHDTEKDANAHMRAINANTETEDKSYVPFSATTFEEVDAADAAMEHIQKLDELTHNYISLIMNIMDSDTQDKAGAVVSLASAFAERFNVIVGSVDSEIKDAPKESVLSKVKGAVRGLVGGKDSNSDSHVDVAIKSLEESGTDMLVWKDKGGTYRWVARYSNKYRDRDNPPEIISSESHRKFASLVELGFAPLPKLWFWHEKNWEFGQSDWVAYDDAGFAVAGGHVYDDPACIELAKCISKMDDVRVSHGMPRWSIKRDKEDKSIITNHITMEISPLPGWAAANPLTGFVVMDEVKENEMAFSDKDKLRLVEEVGVPADVLDQLEELNAAQAKAADVAGVESKDVKPEDVDAEPQEDKDVETEDEAGGNVDALKEIIGLITVLAERVNAQEKTLNEFKQIEEERVAKQAEVTPLAAIMSVAQNSVINGANQAARLDGRSKLAKDGPTEAPSQEGPKVGIPFVDELIRRGK